MCSFGTYCILLWIISSFFIRLTYDTLTFETTQSSTSKTTKLTREFWSHYFVKEYCTRSSCHDVTIVTTKLMWASLKFGKKFIGSLEKNVFYIMWIISWHSKSHQLYWKFKYLWNYQYCNTEHKLSTSQLHSCKMHHRIWT